LKRHFEVVLNSIDFKITKNCWKIHKNLISLLLYSHCIMQHLDGVGQNPHNTPAKCNPQGITKIPLSKSPQFDYFQMIFKI